jgi:hypothetical protein
MPAMTRRWRLVWVPIGEAESVRWGGITLDSPRLMVPYVEIEDVEEGATADARDD